MHESKNILYETWGDKTCWEITLPDGWIAFRDKTIRERNYVIESPCGDKLWIRTEKGVTLHGCDFSIAPKELTLAQQQVFLRAAQDAGNENATEPSINPNEISPLQFVMRQLNTLENYKKRTELGAKLLEKHELGNLLGYVFSPKWSNGVIFKRGYFLYDPWMITIAFQSKTHDLQSWENVCRIISSISFHE